MLVRTRYETRSYSGWRLAERGPRGAGKRRRPSGEPPPLSRQLGLSGRVWIALAASLPVVVGVLLAYGALGVAFDR
jgi:hypothetical protein